MCGEIDRSVSKLYTLATQDGDAILNPKNGKTRVFQRNDLLKVPGDDWVEDRFYYHYYIIKERR